MSVDVIHRNNVTVAGDGPPMVFAHGFGCDQTMWRLVAPAFERDHRTVLFDYIGMGKADRGAYDATRYASLDGYAQDLLEVCEVLDLTGAVFVGHSVSAMIGVLAAIRAPQRFSRLVLIGPSPRYLDDPPDYVGGFQREDIDALLQMMDGNYLGWAAYLAPIVMGNAERPGLAHELERSFCSTDPGIARRFAEVTFLGDNRADLGRCHVPALVLQCAQDAIAPRAVGEYVHRHLPGSELWPMRATGHCPQISHPDETIRLIREYVS